jgi:hypothetical protein
VDLLREFMAEELGPRPAADLRPAPDAQVSGAPRG